VPRRGKDDQVQADASEEVFSYLLCCVCPVKEAKAELGYFPGDNEFHYTAGQIVSAPELGFLFPAFDDRAANIYNALYYSRKPNELHQEFIDAVFHTEPPMSAVEQKIAFESALCDSLEEECSMEVAQSVHERLMERIVEHKESKDPEVLAMTVQEMEGILQDCGVPEERVRTFQNKCEEEFGEGAALNPANLIDIGRYEIKTGEATISVDPSCSYLVETRVIDGRNYLLIPVEKRMEVNGMVVHFPPQVEDEMPQET